jgi:hypothetical protein
MLSTRVNKRVCFDMPLVFVMSAEVLVKIGECRTLRSVLEGVIGLESAVVEDRIRLTKENKLDHVLFLFSANAVAVRLADLNGIHSLLQVHH